MAEITNPTLTRIKKRIMYGVNSSHKIGITLIQESSANTVCLHSLRELEEGNKLTLDINTHIMCENEFFPCESLESLEPLLEIAEDFKSKHVDTRFVKFWLDGPQVEPGPTHCTLNGKGEPDRKRPIFNDETVLAHVTKYDLRGMTCKMHVAGEGSVRQALNIYKRVRRSNHNGPRHEIDGTPMLSIKVCLFRSLL
jgi:predicted amidohydrolase YtcJ